MMHTLTTDPTHAADLDTVAQLLTPTGDRVSDPRLDRWADELDRKVAERTLELQEANATLEQADHWLAQADKLHGKVGVGTLRQKIAMRLRALNPE